MQALVYLCCTSIELRQKEGNKRQEMAEVEEDGERVIVEDEDDIDLDVDTDEEEDDDDYWNYEHEQDEQAENLYDSPLDSMDEVLFFCEKL